MTEVLEIEDLDEVRRDIPLREDEEWGAWGDLL